MEKLGIEPKLLAAQLVNFFIIMLLLNKLLYKPILAMLAKRKDEIARGLALTQKMKDEDDKLAMRQEKAMAKAREEAMVIIEDAKKSAKEVEKELIQKAHDEAALIITRAKEEAKSIAKTNEAALKKQSILLARDMAARLLSAILGAKEQHAVIDAHAKDLEKWVKDSKIS